MRRNTNFFMVPQNWHLDPDVAGLPSGTQLLFLRLVELCHTLGNGGEMTWIQVEHVSRQYGRGKQAVERLVSNGSLSVGSAEYVGKQPGGTAEYVGSTPVRLAHAERWLLVSNPPKSIPAGKKGSLRANGDTEQTRAPAHVKKEREIEREEERTPSGSVRSSSARAAPRIAGGAARPALVAAAPPGGSLDDDDQPTMRRADAIAAARTAIRNGQKNGPATGRDISFSRYDPNRPIVPLRSGFKIDGGAE